MNRLLFVANGVFTLVLLFLLVDQAGDARAAQRPSSSSELQALRSGSFRGVPLRLFPLNAKAPRRLVLDFGRDMVGSTDIDTQPKDLGIRFEPDLPVLGAWRSQSQLVIEPQDDPRPATKYSLHLAESFVSLDGQIIDEEFLADLEPLSFRTSDLELRFLRIEDSSKGDELGSVSQSLVCGFNAKVKLSALRDHVELRSKDDRALRFEVEPSDDGEDRVFRVHLQEDAPAEVAWLLIKSGLKPVGGRYGTAEPIERRVNFFEPLAIGRVAIAEGRLKIQTNQTVALPALDTIRVEPEIPFQIARTREGFELIGAFTPGSSFSVVFAKGFPGSGPQVLKAPDERSLFASDLAARIDFVQRGRVLSSLAYPKIEVAVTNVSKLGVSAQRLYENNLLHFVRSRWGNARDAAFGPAIKKTYPVATPRNIVGTQVVDLADLLGEQPFGLYEIEIWDTEHVAWTRRKLIAVTDLGLTVRSSKESAAVQVRSLATGAPVADAEVVVLTPTNQVLWEGQTDATGVARVHWLETGADRRAYLVTAKKGEDLAFVDFSNYAVELADATLGGSAYTEDLEGYLSTSRGAIRPGETVEASLLVRDKLGQSPAGHPLRIEWRTPKGRVYATQKQSLPGSGLAALEQVIAGSAPTGTWQVRATDQETDALLAHTSFLVEAFVPDRLEAEVTVTDALRIGGTGDVRVIGRWLDGSPAAGRTARVRVRYDRGVFEPKGFESYSFVGPDCVPPGAMPTLPAVLAADGAIDVAIAVPADVNSQTLKASILVEVEDPSGRSVRARTEVPVLRRKGHLGVRARSSGMDISFVNAEGVLSELSDTVKVELVQRTWQYERVMRPRGGWRYAAKVRSTSLFEQDVNLTKGHASVAFDAPAVVGWLVCVARCGNLVVEQAIGAIPDRADRLRVRGPATPVAAGSEAVFDVEAPAAGRGLVTLEGTAIHSAQVLALKAGHNEVRVSIPDGLVLPNLHAVVTWTRGQVGHDDGMHWLIGGAAIVLDQSARSTQVVIVGPAEVLPKSRVAFEIEAPGARSATVALVDVGVLRVTSFLDPDPLAAFLAPRRLDSQGADVGKLLFEKVAFAPGTRTGGDGDGTSNRKRLEGSTSRVIRPLALFKQVSLDAAGLGQVAFDLPEYEGRVHCMVIASGPVVMGAASRSVIVRAPLGLQVAMPRMVAPSDQFEVPVTIKNWTGAGGTVSISCEAEGLQLASVASMRFVEIDDRAVQTISIPVIAGGAGGVQRLRVRAVLGSEQREVEASVEVRNPTVYERRLEGLVFDGESEWTVPEGWAEAELEIRVDTRPDVSLRPTLQALIDYPHGCLEQTTSRSMAVLACRPFVPAMFGKRSPDVDAMIRFGIARVLSMQNRRGGFGWWPGSNREWRFGTVYASEFLLRAKADGFSVPEGALRRAVRRVEWFLSRRVDTSLACYSLDVLSQAGRPVHQLLEQVGGEAILDEDRYHLAMVLARMGRKPHASAMLSHGEAVVTREHGNLLRSKWRSQAMYLSALVAVRPQSPQIVEIARALSQALCRPDRFNTQEQARMLTALVGYYARNRDRGKAIQVVVGQNDERHSLKGGETITLAVSAGQVIKLQSQRTAYGYLVLSGRRAVDRPLETELQGIGLKRRVIDLQTGEEALRFQRGHVYEVRLEGHAESVVENLLVTDVLAGGFECENERLGADGSEQETAIDELEIRDDRVLLFHTGALIGDFSFVYRVRATIPGDYLQPAFSLELLYDPSIRFRSGNAGRVRVDS